MSKETDQNDLPPEISTSTVQLQPEQYSWASSVKGIVSLAWERVRQRKRLVCLLEGSVPALVIVVVWVLLCLPIIIVFGSKSADGSGGGIFQVCI